MGEPRSSSITRSSVKSLLKRQRQHSTRNRQQSRKRSAGRECSKGRRRRRSTFTQHHQLKILRSRMQRTSAPSRAVCSVSKKLKRLPGKQSSEQTSVSRLLRLPETKQKE